ncbi:MAG: DUF6335 family protein [Blastocatellia bacterium]
MNRKDNPSATETARQEATEASPSVLAGQEQMRKKQREHHATSPVLSGGDVDAAWEDADVGEESVSGGNPTPDQSVVEELGEAMGITYEDNEPLHTEEKLSARDKHRWELDPASSEDYQERNR